MIETYSRPIFQRIFVDPVVNSIVRYTDWTPMSLTLVAGLAGVLGTVLLILGHHVFACCLILLSGYLDVVDGSLARRTAKSSPQGAVLDIVVDRIVEFIIMLGLFAVEPTTRGLPVIVMLGSSWICVTSFLVVGIFTQNDSEKSFHYSAGIMERAEAFLFFIAMILLPQWFVPLAWIYTALVSLTAIIRVMQFLR